MNLWLMTATNLQQIMKMMAMYQKFPLTLMGYLRKIQMVLLKNPQFLAHPLVLDLWKLPMVAQKQAPDPPGTYDDMKALC